MTVSIHVLDHKNCCDVCFTSAETDLTQREHLLKPGPEEEGNKGDENREWRWANGMKDPPE